MLAKARLHGVKPFDSFGIIPPDRRSTDQKGVASFTLAMDEPNIPTVTQKLIHFALIIVELSMIPAFFGCGLTSRADRHALFFYHRPTDREWVYRGIAGRLGFDPLCEKISEHSITGADSHVTLLRSDCYVAVAGVQNRPQLCDKVVSISTWLRDGSGYNRDYCRSNLAGHDFEHLESMSSTFASVFAELGYSEDNFMSAFTVEKPEVSRIALMEAGAWPQNFYFMMGLNKATLEFENRLKKLK